MVPPHFSPEALLMLQIFLELSSLCPEASRAQDFSKMASLSLMMGLASISLPFTAELGLVPQLEWMGLCDLGQVTCLSVQLSCGKLEQ